jgi:hypothetical protein
VAVVRPQCLYCGAPLPAAVSVPPPEGERTPVPPTETRADRALVIVALDGVEPSRLTAGLGWSGYEAAQWARRGGFHLLRALAPADAEAERARLASHGLTAFTFDEAGVREAADPVTVLGGGCSEGTLRLRTRGGPLDLGAADLLLVVKGVISREHPAIKLNSPRSAARIPMATLEPGFRFHLHRRGVPRPVEIDPAEFDFGAARASESSLLEVAGWIAEITRDVPVDDGFRRISPALAPVIAPPGAASTLESALRSGGPAPPPILDNLAQFRFYSAWRGAVERTARPR